jgi:hypothetical protein
MIYTVSVTDAEALALSSEAVDPVGWVENAVKERCRVAVENVVRVAVERCLAEGIPVPATKDAIVQLAFQQGWVRSAAEVQAELEAR